MFIELFFKNNIMDIITTSLEALIQRATCNQNQCPDTAAIDAFCGLVNKEPDCAQTATRFITAKVHSLQEWEALQALHVLDTCMKRCGSNFHSEVGKFRFLNELIKLVSPKYNGEHTPEPVKRRVLELMQSWTVYYPREFKIKEAYEMLKKQGVVKEDSMRLVTDAHKSLDQGYAPNQIPVQNQDSIFQDQEKSRLLQKLLQSKNPDDLQAANRLIKTMVKEDERRIEMKSRQLSELEAANNNARLLSEMLDSYSREVSSTQDLELITELHTSCQRFRPNIQKLLSEVYSEERLFNEVLAAHDELSEVLDKYKVVIIDGVAVGGNLLDLSSPSVEALPAPVQPPSQPAAVSLLCDNLTDLGLDTTVKSSGVEGITLPLPPPQASLSDLSALGDLFSSLAQPTPLSASPIKSGKSEQLVSRTGLEELDAISESLLRQNLPQSGLPLSSTKCPVKVPMNQLPSHQASPVHSTTTPVHSTLLLSPLPASTPAPDSGHTDLASDITPNPASVSTLTSAPDSPITELQLNSSKHITTVNGNGDSPMVDITFDHIPDVEARSPEEVKMQAKNDGLLSVLPLGDLTVPLESIKPGKLAPLKVLNERGVTVVIHFGCNTPRPDVSVYVVTTTSEWHKPITNYQFQAIVPKGCRLRLQPPSGTELPAHSPFLPPAAITQVMLIASPQKDPILLRVVVSFTIKDETVTEMKEVPQFPMQIL